MKVTYQNAARRQHTIESKQIEFGVEFYIGRKDIEQGNLKCFSTP